MQGAAWWRSSRGLGGADPKAFPVERRLMDDLKEKVSAYMWSESLQHYFQVKFKKQNKTKLLRLSFTWGKWCPAMKSCGWMKSRIQVRTRYPQKW